MLHNLERIIRAWQVSEGHTFNAAADEDALLVLEQHLHRRLAPEFRRLCQFSDGAYLLNGNFKYWPWRGQECSLWDSARFLREPGRVLPEGLLVFVDDGSDSLFGVWLRATASHIFDPPIVEVGEIVKPGGMAVAGTSLVPLLQGWTVYYSLLEDVPSREAFDALGAPEELRFGPNDMDEEQFAQWRRWADPQLPDPEADPHTSRYDGNALESLFCEQSYG